MLTCKPIVPFAVVVACVAAMNWFGAVRAGEKDKDFAARVAERVQAWQPTADERRFDEIGWATEIREAERLAQKHDRPIFLFTHDGHMAIGRC